MYTILQQGEQDAMFYTLQVNGADLEHFITLEAACAALERCKEASPKLDMERWFSGEADYE